MDKKQDRHLDVPAEANRDKHINFLEEESRVGDNEPMDERATHTRDEESRRREWEKGLKEGRQNESKNND